MGVEGYDTYVYVIDRDDRIVEVSDNWLSFALENQAAESCHPDNVINKPIWHFIDVVETTHLYKIIIKKSERREHMLLFLSGVMRPTGGGTSNC